MIHKILLIKRVAWFCLVTLVFCGSAAQASGSEQGKITSIITEGSNVVSILLDGPDYIAECSGGWRWTITTSDPLFKEKFATLLSAAAAGQTVTLFYSSSSGCGPMNSSSIYYVQVSY